MAIGIGQVVVPRAGGPQMTVTNIEGGCISCTWTDSEGGLHSETFPATALVAYFESGVDGSESSNPEDVESTSPLP